MNPDKLFDYLDGNLPKAERDQLEQEIARDPQLQREVAIAREIHKRGVGSREVLGVADASVKQQRPGTLGRRIAIIFSALALLNVLFGIAVIIGRHGKKAQDPSAEEASIRAQLTESLEKAANAALPLPVIAKEIKLTALASQRDAIADKIIAMAVELGGAGNKGLPDDSGLTVLAEVPGNHESAFEQALVSVGGPSPVPNAASEKAGTSEDKILLQVRITTIAPARTP